MALAVVQVSQLSIRAACVAFSISETCYRYQPKYASENDAIADWLIRLTNNQRNWGVWLMLFVSAQCAALSMEPQKGLPHIP